jgi:hypothetical protein
MPHRGFRHWRWHLDEMYVKLIGSWWACDKRSAMREILQSFVIIVSDKQAALTFIKKAPSGSEPASPCSEVANTYMACACGAYSRVAKFASMKLSLGTRPPTKRVKLSISERAIALRPSSAVASALFKQQDNGQWHLDTEEYRGLQSRSFRRRKDKKDEGLCRPKMSGRANQVHKLVSTSD